MPQCRKCRNKCDESELHSMCNKSDNHEIWCNDCIISLFTEEDKNTIERACILCNSVNVIECDFEYTQDEIVETNYENDELNGENVKCYFDNTSKVESIGNYRKGIKYGNYVTFYENGNKHIESNYDENGKLHGICYLYNHNGNKEAIENYEHGFKNGLQKYYTQCDTFNAYVCREENYENSVKSLVTYYEKELNSEHIYISCIETYKNNNLESIINYYSENRIKSKAYYKNGKLDGTYILYNEDNTVLLNGIYKDGIPFSGKLLYEHWQNQVAHYQDGLLHGDHIEYYTPYNDRKIHILTPYKNNMKNGIQKVYDKNNNLVSTTEYKENKKCGKSQFFTYKYIVKNVKIKSGEKKNDISINNLLKNYKNTRSSINELVSKPNAPMMSIGSNEVPGINEEIFNFDNNNMNQYIMNAEDEFMKRLQERGF